MSPGDLMKLLGRASGVELGGDSESPRYVVTLKFES